MTEKAPAADAKKDVKKAKKVKKDVKKDAATDQKEGVKPKETPGKSG